MRIRKYLNRKYIKKKCLHYMFNSVFYFFKKIIKYLKYSNSQKIFCIGLNKTGTTSLKHSLSELGFIVGSESEAKKLLYPWLKRDFKPIIDYCKTAQAFQDSPFSFPFTYIALDQAFPNSKFILSVRDDEQQWYNSITRFHAKLWGKDGRIPTKEDLIKAKNSTIGRPWIVNQALFNTPDFDPYNKDLLIKFYNEYIYNVKEYFKTRPNDLLVINLKDKDSYQRFCNFLGMKQIKDQFPWENKT